MDPANFIMQKIEKGFLTINVSDFKENYGQRNNEYVHTNSKGIVDIKGSTMCMDTSLVMAADYNGWVFPKDAKWKQPEDAFTNFLVNSKEVDDYYRTHMPTLYADYKAEKADYYTPNEVHAVVAFAFNKWMGCEVDTFKENAKITEIINELIEGRACVLSGKFNKLNHVVCLVGAKWGVTKDSCNAKQLSDLLNEIQTKSRMPDYFIIDDPYGDFHDNYRTQKGNDIEMSYKDFIHIFKPIDNGVIKYAHILKSGSACI